MKVEILEPLIPIPSLVRAFAPHPISVRLPRDDDVRRPDSPCVLTWHTSDAAPGPVAAIGAL